VKKNRNFSWKSNENLGEKIFNTPCKWKIEFKTKADLNSPLFLKYSLPLIANLNSSDLCNSRKKGMNLKIQLKE
jgi:hypothetical protein